MPPAVSGPSTDIVSAPSRDRASPPRAPSLRRVFSFAEKPFRGVSISKPLARIFAFPAAVMPPRPSNRISVSV